MALVVADRVQETSLTSGTGTLTLAGAVAGYQTFSTAIGNGNTTFYTIYDPTAYDWEVGIGTVGAGTLARTTVLSNSAGTTSPISFAGNSKSVFCTYPAEKSINYDANGVATIGEVLGYADTGIVGSFASTVAGYNQVVVQNKSTATNASSNFNVSNDAGTAGSNYAELGINSSTFVGTGSFNIAGASYVASASTDLTIGTYGAYSIHFVTNSNTTDAMTIYNNGGVSLGTFGNPGINNLAASKFVPGYTAVTSAAGTTVLTADSNYYQNLLGSTTQTFRLPDATTLLVGTTFIFDNNSTGVLTIVDNASGSVDTLPSGAAGFVYLANNSTVAGSWNRHSFLPVTYDFNATTANFGNAAITNATWNGTTIASGYGGTGLTTFAAANNALYSTSSSALVAGTLPIAAGGTAATTFTANGVLYGNGTSALGVTAVGTTGQVLIGNTGAAPSWGTISSSLVSSFQTSLSGLTPSTATTGAVTLAGTLGTSSGGTNLTSFTSGGALYATSTSALTTGILPIASGGTSAITATAAFDALNPMTTVGDIIYEGTGPSATRLGIGSTGQVLTVSGGIPSWASPASNVSSISFGSTGLTPSTATTGAVTVAGTLAATSGGTGLSAYTTGDIIYASATNTLSALADVATGNALISGGVGVAPLWGKIGLTTHVSGTLPVANGGTNASSAGITAFNNITGYSATGATGTTTGNLVFDTAPTFVTSINGGTTFSAFASSTALTIGFTGTGTASTTNISTAALTGAFAKTVNIGTGGTTGSTTGVNINTSVGGTTTVRGALLVGAATSSTTDGAIFATNNITAFAASDIKFKENVRDIPNALEKVEMIGGKLFEWSDKYIESMGGKDDYFMRKEDAGVIAQDVEKAMPELVRSRDDGSLAVDYPKLVALAFAAIKELKVEIDKLKGK